MTYRVNTVHLLMVVYVFLKTYTLILDTSAINAHQLICCNFNSYLEYILTVYDFVHVAFLGPVFWSYVYLFREI